MKPERKYSRAVALSPEETLEVGRVIARNVLSSTVVCFFGDLGVGKTTLIKGFASEFMGISPHEVTSPTFNYLNIYEGDKTLYHFDLYRLTGASDFSSLGFEEYFEKMCCIEWAEKIEEILPENRAMVKVEYLGKDKREISYEI